MKLYIGNKNYSSWSMRPWVLLRQSGIAFDEVMVRFDSFAADSRFKSLLKDVSPTARVPVLDDDGLVVWDSLAIAEYLAERFPERALWPAERALRARARSICCEMHSGFSALRQHCPMNIEARLPDIGRLKLRDIPAVRTDHARIVQMWGELLAEHAERHADGMLFGAFSIADAYYAPVAMRFRTYALPVTPAVGAYIERLCALPGVKAWIDEALAERDFLDFEEPYRLTP
jgi:glutathione S-transferase